MRFEGRELAPPERDHVEALDSRFRPASRRNLQVLARVGVEEIDASELEFLPRKARRRDGTGFYRYDTAELDEASTASAYSRVGGFVMLLREPGVEPHLVSRHVATIRERSIEDVIVHMPAEFGGVR
jgi:hypothetical protein